MPNGTGNDTTALWVDPTSLGGSEPAADLTFDNGGVSNVSAANGINGFAFRALPANKHGVYEIDEIRAGDTWADITPTTGVFYSCRIVKFSDNGKIDNLDQYSQS